MSWYPMYVSFASGEGFIGGAVVRGAGPRAAVKRCRELKFAPADCPSVLTIPVVDESELPEERWRDRLLSRAELIEAGILDADESTTDFNKLSKTEFINNVIR